MLTGVMEVLDSGTTGGRVDWNDGAHGISPGIKHASLRLHFAYAAHAEPLPEPF